MTIIETFTHEFEHECITTRKMLALVPADKNNWAPHEKSMKLGNLANHVAELPEWIGMSLLTDGLDFAVSPYEAKMFDTNEALMAFAEKAIAKASDALEKGKHIDLSQTWTLRHGEMVLSEGPKWEMMRMSMSQIIHHRAQLGVYLRLLHIPLPDSYGPSADDTGM
ncbi:MAG: DinB family protein [Bacteroidia bacterium]|jgi:uncharacterized damage-inducible protein DinB|nr:DinB family protein [Bacteroidia bacterium]